MRLTNGVESLFVLLSIGSLPTLKASKDYEAIYGGDILNVKGNQ